MGATVDAATPPLRAYLLGPVRLALDTTPISDDAWPRRTARSLLLLLLATPGHKLPRDRVMDLLWPEASPEAATNALYLALSALRRVLEPRLTRGRDSAYVVSGGDVIALRSDPPPWVDVGVFQTLVGGARAAAPLERRRMLREALELYAGEFLGNEPFVDWVHPTAERLRLLRIRAVLELARLDMDAGEPETAIAPLETLLLAEPTEEDTHRLLIRVLAATGRREAALRQFERCRQALATELGVEPSAETVELVTTLQVVPPPAPNESSVPGTPYNNLPTLLTPLIGRARETDAIHGLLWRSDVRLVTLTGPGGVGKTRLAIEAARQIADEFRDGVCFVGLAALRDPNLVVATIARTLGVEERGGSFAKPLQVALRDREMLLLLDNMEQVIAAAPEVAALLEGAPQLTVLATIRESLRVRGERVVTTLPLTLPPRWQGADRRPLAAATARRYEAVALFADRAAAACPDFALTDATVSPVTAICARLDGLPLAIELAAVRVRELPVDRLLAGLERRLDVLIGGYRDLPVRQQTMRDTIAWSYDLLAPEEQRLFPQLAVFAGGFTMEAAEAVTVTEDRTSSVPALLASLTDKHLLQREESDDGARFGMLETIREFGQERLEESGEADLARSRHAAFFLRLAESAEGELMGPDETRWLDRFETEHDNLRTALAWSTAHGGDGTSLRLSGVLWRFWWIRGYLGEGRRWADTALARDVGTAAERAKGLYAAGGMAQELGDIAAAAPILEDGFSAALTAEDWEVAALCLSSLGFIARDRGDYEEANRLFSDTVALYRRLGTPRGLAVSLGNLGVVATYQGHHGRAAELLAEALAMFRALGHRHAIGQMLSNFAVLQLQMGDYREARRLSTEALALQRAIGDRQAAGIALINLASAARGEANAVEARRYANDALALFRTVDYQSGMAVALGFLANVALDEGEAERAVPLLMECLSLLRPIDDREAIYATLDDAARVAAAFGNPTAGARLFAAAAQMRAARGADVYYPSADAVGRAIAFIRERLGDTSFAEAEAEGRAHTVEQAINDAIETVNRLGAAGSMLSDTASPPLSVATG